MEETELKTFYDALTIVTKVLPKSTRSVVIHCGTNNIDTSSSDEISVGVVTIARSIFHCYPNIENIVVAYYQEPFIGLHEELKLMRPMII